MTDEIVRAGCLWDKLAERDRPIVLYGTGNGADKLIAALHERGLAPDGVFASAGFVRRRAFAGMEVLSREEAETRFGRNMTVLIAFGSSLPAVMEQMRETAARYETYMPELPLFGGALFDPGYYEAHRAQLGEARALLADDASRALFDDMIRFRLSGKLEYLSRTEAPEYIYRTFFGGLPIRTAVDGGAFRGDSAAALLRTIPTLAAVYAAEPDPRTFRRLSEYASSSGGAVIPLPFALADAEGNAAFAASGSRGAGSAGSARRAHTESVSRTTIDRIAENVHIDLIKLDVEGDEARALSGAANTLRRDRPALAVSVYHRTEDLFALPLALREALRGDYTHHLRRAPCYPAWDLLWIAVPHA